MFDRLYIQINFSSQSFIYIYTHEGEAFIVIVTDNIRCVISSSGEFHLTQSFLSLIKFNEIEHYKSLYNYTYGGTYI